MFWALNNQTEYIKCVLNIALCCCDVKATLLMFTVSQSVHCSGAYSQHVVQNNCCCLQSAIYIYNKMVN